MEELRILRRLQRNIERMLRSEHILILSRNFTDKPKLFALQRVMRFIREEVDAASTIEEDVCRPPHFLNPNGLIYLIQTVSGSNEQQVGRFKVSSSELVLVMNPEEGMRRLRQRLSNLSILYCSLKELKCEEGMISKRKSLRSSTKSEDNNVEGTKIERLDSGPMIFFSCGIDDTEAFGKVARRSSRYLSQKVGQIWV